MRYTDLINNSNKNIDSFIVVKKTPCFRQISDTIFEEMTDFINAQETYDGEIVYKRNNKFYLNLGYDTLLGYEAFIPIIYDNNELNIIQVKYYNTNLKMGI